MAVGPVVSEVSKDFDRYWASESSYPAAGSLPAVNPAQIAELASAASQIEAIPQPLLTSTPCEILPSSVNW